jgi:tetratricopeptide (TPR) repeat protein
VASALAETGAFKQALDAARSIDSDVSRRRVLSELASALARVGSFDQTQPLFEPVLDAARSIERDKSRVEAVSEVASALAEASSIDWAFDIAQSIDSGQVRAETFIDISRSCADAGNAQRAQTAFDEAIDATESIDSVVSDRAKAEALSGVASALADVGSFERALDIARSIDYDSERDRVLSDLASTFSKTGDFDRALDSARSIDDRCRRAAVFSGVSEALARIGNLDSAVEVSLSIGDLSERASAIEEIAKQQSEDGHADAFAEHLPAIELAHDGWTNFLSTWREALLEHEEDPCPLLRQSLTLYPFDAEAAAEGVYSLVQAHVQAGAMDHAEAIARECPKLELDVLVQDSEPPIPEGCDPEKLTGFFEQQFEDLVESYEHGDLDDAAFKENAKNILKAADPE